ncbi:hypothetical protein [Anaerotignum propionicum]|jgi:hypothetical protein|uniref:Uncharacterized protein n=1 Tax=Anaerotignum propionicum DSM 1682 TaxID=991789 RepID=A0A120MKE5_ANAPI|nr:hypothetical protein [Anaerotignum propionicum]AMJ42021.1 hypothetical protein CPRO_24550 [Anaerotignum propionicum DSM 1682]SHF02669.1 hypothetical protein SAMN02745151_02537 [[Clostridium] propionicum DSM 1682] [Anaerotignum propionicum DSM 1682]
MFDLISKKKSPRNNQNKGYCEGFFNKKKKCQGTRLKSNNIENDDMLSIDERVIKIAKIKASSYSNNYTLVIKSEVFAVLMDNMYLFKSQVIQYIQDIDLAVHVALETEETLQGLVGHSLISNDLQAEENTGSLKDIEKEVDKPKR